LGRQLILPLASVGGRGDGDGDGDPWLLFLDHTSTVHCGSSLVDLTNLVRFSGVVKNTLGGSAGGGLSSINVGHDSECYGTSTCQEEQIFPRPMDLPNSFGSWAFVFSVVIFVWVLYTSTGTVPVVACKDEDDVLVVVWKLDAIRLEGRNETSGQEGRVSRNKEVELSTNPTYWRFYTKNKYSVLRV
jgi:hypothetical protein